MNNRQKQQMYAHYRSLGWNDNEIAAWGTQDLRGGRPADKEAARKAAEKAAEKAAKKAAKSKDSSE